jgi:hypothetical protein
VDAFANVKQKQFLEVEKTLGARAVLRRLKTFA